MPVYLPTPQDMGSRLFYIKEITNFEKSEYAYLTVILESSQQTTTTVVFYKYPSTYAPFMSKLAGYAPIHRVRFTPEAMLSFYRDEVCPCGHRRSGEEGYS